MRPVVRDEDSRAVKETCQERSLRSALRNSRLPRGGRANFIEFHKNNQITYLKKSEDEFNRRLIVKDIAISACKVARVLPNEFMFRWGCVHLTQKAELFSRE
jgi:hypothetical protein